MVEGCGGPSDRVVTGRTVGNRKYRGRCRVVRVGGLLPSGQMAPGSSASIGRRRQIVIVVDVAVGAGGHLAGRR